MINVVLIRVDWDLQIHETKFFPDVEFAQFFAETNYGIPMSAWESYLMRPRPENSTYPAKYNGDDVEICGWRHEKNEEHFYIHCDEVVVEF